MSKVKDYYFTDTPREVLADTQDMQNCEFDNDPAYVEWSDKPQKQFDKEFGGNANKTGDIPQF